MITCSFESGEGNQVSNILNMQGRGAPGPGLGYTALSSVPTQLTLAEGRVASSSLG